MENSNFRTLKRDFNSCQLPSPYDPMTVKTLCSIVDDIEDGKTTLAEFEDYLAENKMGLTPMNERGYKYFGDECLEFVSNVLSYFDSKRR